MMHDTVIEIEKLFLKMKGNDLLSDFSIKISNGERIGITGPSGCGKSTLLKSIIKGSFPKDSTTNKFLKNKDLIYSYIPQTNGLLPWYSLQKNLEIFKKNESLYEETINRLKLTNCLNNFPHQLSGGEYQRSILATAIIYHPNVFFADEPLTELDIVNKWDLLSFWSEKIEQSKSALIMISHDIDTLIYMCDKIVILSDKPATILNQFSINIPHTRSRDFLVSDDFINFKKQILESIQKK
ncbi:ABC transporter ATP-binding protein [Bacteroidia bacterium]|nr:ABC transporter ATP-binding protein [Bacteroidia bacterium]